LATPLAVAQSAGNIDSAKRPTELVRAIMAVADAGGDETVLRFGPAWTPAGNGAVANPMTLVASANPALLHSNGLEPYLALGIDPVGLSFQTSPPKAADAAKQADPKAGSKASLAAQATNPASALIQFQVQNVFVPGSYNTDDYANQLYLQPVVPLKGLGSLPRTVWRLTIPILSNPGIDGTSYNGKTGLGDTALLGGPSLDFEWGMLIAGVSAVFPTATDESLGARMWQLGPAIGPIFTKVVPNLQFGAVVWNNWSLGGPANTNLNSLHLQPVLIYHLPDSWYAGMGDFAFTFNHKTNKNYVPLSLRVGKVFGIGSQNFNVFVSPFYNVGHGSPGQARWGIKLSITLLFPE
jgi:hypothetical protein